ncbi:hypothetical protein [Virgibacillus sp. CBA3643]|uniref:hypothetical protein n=1 Tax=Virgibacillus sp. CBA3643 TaxID=2942278 RepID=UPI0035A28CBF
MNYVPLDRYFIRKDIIEKRQRNEHMRQINVAMIPHMDDKQRKKIIEDLQRQDRQPLNVGKGTETDFDGLKALKAKQNSM